MHTGSTLAHYRIVALLGRGGMGDVYEATDTRLDRRLAIKVLASRYVADEEAKARFIQEAKAASSLDHPNICTIHDIGRPTTVISTSSWPSTTGAPSGTSSRTARSRSTGLSGSSGRSRRPCSARTRAGSSIGT